MWLDDDNDLNLVSMDQPERLLTDDLFLYLSDLPDADLEQVARAVDGWLQRAFDANEAFVAEPLEAGFVNADPPAEFRLRLLEPVGELIRSLEEQLDRTPLRWRTDLTMALLMLVEVDIPLARTS